MDEGSDLAHAISCLRASRRRPRHQGLFVPRRVLNWIDFLGLKVTTPPNENHDPRQYIDK